MVLFKLDATDSTNSYLKELARRKELPNWAVVRADFQDSGRGQQGASWESAPGKNLLFSILHRSNSFKATDQFYLNCAVSLGIHKVLSRHKIPDLSVKWPNDIMSGSQKLAGILIENSLMRDRISQSIIGVGLNVNQKYFSPDLPKACSMLQLLETSFDLDQLLKELVEGIRYYAQWIDEGNGTDLLEAYKSVMYKFRKPHMFRLPAAQHPFLGMITGVDQQGLLKIEMEDGSNSTFHFKEVLFM